jgi:hypothetical protein
MPQSKKHRQTKGSAVSTPLILAALSGVILIVAGVLALINSNRSAATPSTVRPAATLSSGAAAALPDSHNEEGIPYPKVPRISPTDAKAAVDAGTAVIVDVRSQGEYDTAHVSTAISLPLADLEARYQELPQDAEIITYCT